MMSPERICPKCGSAFFCGAGTGECWCAEFPPIMTVPKDEAETCFCRKCLQAEINARIEKNSSSSNSSQVEKDR